MKRPLALIAALCLWACITTEPNHPKPDAGTGGAAGTGGSAATGGASPVGLGGSSAVTKCQQVCRHLAELGCPEDDATCDRMCTLYTSDNRFTLDLDCRLNARTKAELQQCGPSSCR